MFKYYLKSALRNFKSNKLIFGGSIITVLLCSLCISLLFTYIHNELSMDDIHMRKNDIYMMTIKQSAESKPEGVETSGYFNFDYTKYPELESKATLKKYDKDELRFSIENYTFSPAGLVVDSTFFRMFDFQLKVGDRKNILQSPDALILSERLAHKIFGSENPIGKTITVNSRQQNVYTVKGIAQNPPSNSSIKFDFILRDKGQAFDRSGIDFLLANSNFDEVKFEKKIKNIGHQHPQFKASTAQVMPLKDIYFDRKDVDVNSIFIKSGDRKSLQVLMAIIAIIFIISALNFSNLQIININSSLKNIGINKVAGAGSRHILYQKLTELLVLIILSALLITGLYQLVLPKFNLFTGVELQPQVWQIFLINVTILTSLSVVAMIYPTIISLRIPITNSLKNLFFSSNKLVGRKVVATVQFTLSFVLLIISMIVVKQLNLMLDKDLGFSSENTIHTKLVYEPSYSESWELMNEQYQSLQKNYQYINDELSSHSSVKYYSQGFSPIDAYDMPWKIKDGENDYTTEKTLTVTPKYANMFGLTVVEGRFFDEEKDESDGHKLVINQAAKRLWNIKDISQTQFLNKYWSMKGESFEIVGVVKDFNFEHLSVKPHPLLMLYSEDEADDFLIHFEKGTTQAGLQFVESLFMKSNPNQSFRYTFLSDEIAAMYDKEKRLSMIYILFTIIAFIISAIGLFTIALYDTRKRTKEIGVRKANGARVAEILTMLNKDFVKWVVIAFILACPIAYYAMDKWLENFAYKTELSWWIFALAGILALGIALLTVSWQSWKAATRNPVEALRYE
ncbi:FtsX-like permease family protein [Puteibacter caeruleilacunae]|nr:FtsX-like permease family protein [Puteibacter caeruleilacunae]